MTTSPLPENQPRIRRYPGVRPFDDNRIHRLLFRGRDAEAYDLIQLILAERLVVLFARSGVGKSSIINAGVMQPLRDKGFFPMAVRVSAMRHDPIDSVYNGVRVACDSAKKGDDEIACEPEDPSKWNRTSLWHFFKSFYIWRGESELLTPVLIIDQFEELFTLLSKEQRRPFISELANLARGVCPAGSSAERKGSELELGDGPPDVRIVLAIREDFMANLEEMAERIPTILKARFRLRPLEIEQAKLAIVEPAALADPTLEPPPFSWSDEALEHTLDFLRQRKARDGGTEMGEEVEPFQLQLVCQYVEDLVQKRKLTTVSSGDLGGKEALPDILTRFYQETIDEICATFRPFGLRRLALRRRLRHFCEYGLLTDNGRRRLLEESTIRKEYRIAASILPEMVQRRLIRKEPRVGDNYYELTHDTLIYPILEGRQRRERNKRLYTRWAAAVAVVVTIGAAFVIWFQSERLSRLENKSRAAVLREHGRDWGNRGNYKLAVGFYDLAIRYDKTLESELPRTIADEQRRVENPPQAEAEARKAEAKAQADRVIQRAAAVTDDVIAGQAARGGSRQESALTEGERRQLDDEIDSLVSAGRALAAGRFVAEAIRVYDKAQELAGRLGSEDRSIETPRIPRSLEARRGESPQERLRLPVPVEEQRSADLLARASYIKEALSLYMHVREKHPDVPVSAANWNQVCWIGGLFGYEHSVMMACENGVAAASEADKGFIRDSRGLVIALTSDDSRAAIDDFSYYVHWAPGKRPSTYIRRRQEWIKRLREGGNPFKEGSTKEELKLEETPRVQSAKEILTRVFHPRIELEESLSELLKEWSLSPAILGQLRASNDSLCPSVPLPTEPWTQEAQREIKKLKGRIENECEPWKAASASDIQSHRCSAYLKALTTEWENILDEVFVTNSLGFNACMSQKTEDSYQADEPWWVAARLFQPYVGMPRSLAERDRSTGQKSISVFVAVRDPRSGDFLGVIKAVFRANSLKGV